MKCLKTFSTFERFSKFQKLAFPFRVFIGLFMFDTFLRVIETQLVSTTPRSGDPLRKNEFFGMESYL